MNFNPPPPQDVIQAGITAVQQLVGTAGAVVQDQAADKVSKLDARLRLAQAERLSLEAMIEILMVDLSTLEKEKREWIEALKEQKQKAMDQIIAMLQVQAGLQSEYKKEFTEKIVQMLERVVTIVVCVIAIVVAVMVSTFTLGSTGAFTAFVLICAVAVIAAAVGMLAVTITMNVTPLLKGVAVLGKHTVGTANPKEALDAATRAALIKASAQTRGMVTEFQAEALTKQAQIQRTVESFVTAFSTALSAADATTSATLERVRQEMLRAVGPAVEKVIAAKDRASQGLQRAYGELLQAVRMLLMRRP